jgi:hypothetical protein
MMKRKFMLVIAAILMIAGCKSTKEITIPAYQEIVGIDFRPYAEKGFLITPLSYGGRYTSIALIDFKIMPQANLVVSEKADNSDQSSAPTVLEWHADTIGIHGALKNIYEHCIEIGADGLIDFSIEEVSDSYPSYPAVLVKGKRITGLAIKRED